MHHTGSGVKAGFHTPTLQPIRRSCRQSGWGLRSDFAVPVIQTGRLPCRRCWVKENLLRCSKVPETGTLASKRPIIAASTERRVVCQHSRKWLHSSPKWNVAPISTRNSLSATRKRRSTLSRIPCLNLPKSMRTSQVRNCRCFSTESCRTPSTTTFGARKSGRLGPRCFQRCPAREGTARS